MGVVVTLLGPFRVVCDGTDVTPSSTKAQALLATLAVQPGAIVPADRLVDDLWSDLTPERGRRVLQVRIAEIRKQLAAAGASPRLAVQSVADGYRLAVLPDALDSVRFVRRVEDAVAAGQRGELAAASTMLREALGMWRGEALAGIRCSRALESAAAELEERRLAAIEERVAAELAEGCHQRLVAELEPLVAAHPLRERLWEQLVLALYRSDRQTEALRACALVRRQLRDEIGVAPGPRLRRLEAAVLAHDPMLDAPAVTPAAVDARSRGGAPPVRYVRTVDGVDLALQITGDGPDLLFVQGFPSHLDLWWEPWGGGFMPALAEFCRVIVADKRGMGLSGRPPNFGLQQWLDDVELVRQTAGAERPIVFGMSAGGPVALTYAARHLEHVAGLILYGTRARYVRAADYPFGVDQERLDAALARFEGAWGTGEFFEKTAPSAAGDPWLRAEFTRYERLSASPASARAFAREVFAMDVRDVLPAVDVPTLVLHATGDRTDPVDQARYMAARLPRARMIELDSPDHLLWLSNRRGQLVEAIRAFVHELGDAASRPHATAV